MRELAMELGCEVGDWPIKYLGLPLGGNPRKEFWELLFSKVAKRLDGWKKTYFKGWKINTHQFSAILHSSLLFIVVLCACKCGGSLGKTFEGLPLGGF